LPIANLSQPSQRVPPSLRNAKARQALRCKGFSDLSRLSHLSQRI
jgi:hypothetical protein